MPSVLHNLLLLLPLLLVAASAAAAAAGGDPLLAHEALFDAWCAEHGRAYATPGERAARLAVFADNAAFVAAHNARAAGAAPSYTLALNAFADLTHDEFRAARLRRLAVGPALRSGGGGGSGVAYGGIEGPVPDAVDWRESGAVTEVKDQGSCGACWSFSATGAMEGINKINTGSLVSLSEQELIDCDRSYNNGCNGGLMDYAFKFVVKNGGIDTEEDYPYREADGTCNKNKLKKRVVTIDGYSDVPSNKEDLLLQAVAQQPVSVGICGSSREFQLYSQGIFDGPCPKSLDHAVLIVGYGSEGDKDYWIVKNSWGEVWGMKGYMYMHRNTGDASGVCVCLPTVLKDRPVVALGVSWAFAFLGAVADWTMQYAARIISSAALMTILSAIPAAACVSRLMPMAAFLVWKGSGGSSLSLKFPLGMIQASSYASGRFRLAAPFRCPVTFLSMDHEEGNGTVNSITSINGKSPIVVGPWGGTGGYPWDDGVYSTIRQIVISHGAAIDSIRIEYDLKGRSVWSETHGGTDGGSETDKVKLDFPDEVLVSVSGHYGSVCGTPVIIRSLTFQSNSSKYGPFGTEDGTPFSLPVSSGKIIGFHGRSGSYLNSIGFYLKQVHFPNPMDSSPSPRSLPSVHSRNGYSFTGSDTGPEMVLSVRDRGDSYAVYASNYPKQQYTNPSPDYNDGTLWNKMVSFPSYYGDQGAPAIKVPQTYGPWGGSGGTIFDDGVYTGVWQINLTRAVGISSIKVLYDRNGQAVWGNKHGFSGGVIPDKIIFDFPSEVLTHITGFYDSAIIMGPTVVRSLTFHTNKRTYGPYGDEYGTYFSTSFTNGRIVGFHGREGWYIDGIGVHVQEGKVAPQRFVSRPTTMTSPSLHYNTLAPAQSDTYTDNEFAYGMVKEPVPMGPGPWGGEGGRPWDDGVYSGVKQVYIMRGAFIGSIQVEYDRGGYSVWSSRHGNSGHITHRVKLDYPHEVLTCVYGYYNTSRDDGPRVLRSLTFVTNRGKYGPFGDEGGAFFSSATTEGKVVGFHGRSGQHLDAIGVHMQHWLADRRPAPKYMLSKYLF
ncbi:hypothetical protein U9M48_044513 [Paspalum notatum var. saurae]|uniref:Jacalin-type lectin domain-containing protein n=1 Tax=Paspalum notatum var. saurae TaxID=547442 RepID=A0AAQ3UVA2_PASNO